VRYPRTFFEPVHFEQVVELVHSRQSVIAEHAHFPELIEFPSNINNGKKKLKIKFSVKLANLKHEV